MGVPAGHSRNATPVRTLPWLLERLILFADARLCVYKLLITTDNIGGCLL